MRRKKSIRRSEIAKNGPSKRDICEHEVKINYQHHRMRSCFLTISCHSLQTFSNIYCKFGLQIQITDVMVLQNIAVISSACVHIFTRKKRSNFSLSNIFIHTEADGLH